MEDWYSVSSKTLEEHTSIFLMRMYDRYTMKAVMSIYPGIAAIFSMTLEYNWQPWRFKELPPGFWIQNKKYHRPLFDYIANNLNISDYEQWYTIKKDKIDDNGLLLSCYHGSLPTALKSLYPGA